ncbi:50S ribosomal protein L15 [Xanthobacter agilis]|jgi:large subunit ribosomal protein L15|uniref:Large ribosomal subunit protein uL15 n=1 Tax=Xanthobacter agilis TaxID=47492 RepID=A0ABU0LA48_XANAG|nr:50S ribosomal protein L15 [Xanthobacter agilis]MDQ0504008.1 large subunit ribosomal protein L15 [Xanthobacter agilis]
MKLDEIRDNPGARKGRIRVGRGIGSGKGKTGGRGVKGQKSRTGVAVKGFEGGQMPLHRRLPKRGFHNIFRLDYNEVSIGRIQAAIDEGKLNAAEPITVSVLVAAGLLRRLKDGVRVLGGGELKSPVTLEVAYATASVTAAVEAAGGKLILLAAPTVAAEAV